MNNMLLLNNEKIEISAKAKINLSLNVLGIVNDYHMLDMVVASIGICDTILLKKRKDSLITFACNDNLLPFENTATEAARMFVETFSTCGVDIMVDKGIPIEAGLGGSSADAAGVLNGMQILFGKQSRNKINQIATKVGSDVPYMLTGGFARVMGKGEIVQPFISSTSLAVVVAKKNGGVSTSKAYSQFDLKPSYVQVDNDKFVNDLMAGNLENLQLYMKNDLQKVSMEIQPQIVETIDEMQKTKPIACVMSGSGSSVIGVYANFVDAKKAEKFLKDKIEFVVATTTI